MREDYIRLTEENIWDYADGVDFVDLFGRTIFESYTKQQYLEAEFYPRSARQYWRTIDGKKQNLKLGVIVRDEQTEFSEFKEKLADECHEQWCHWMRYLFSQSDILKDGQVIIPKDLANRWKRQVETPYTLLSEKEKDSDRNQADKFLDIINGYKY